MTRTVRLSAAVVSMIGAALLAETTAAHAVPVPTSTSTGDGLVVWSHAASLDDVDVTVNLLIARPDGSGQLTLTPKQTGVSDIDPTMSPDGSRVLFSRNHDGTADQRVIPAAGGKSVKLELGCRGTCIGDDKGTWLSKHRIAFTRYVEDDRYKNGYAAILYSARDDGSHVRRLSPRGPDGIYEEMYARYAPGRDYFVFSRQRIRDGAAAVFRMAPDGGEVRQLTPWSLLAQLPHISPATSGPTAGLVVFQSYGEGNPDGSARDLVTVPASCQTLSACRQALQYVTHNGMGTGRASNPAWSPDGSHLVYAGRPSEDDVNCEIITIAFDGTGTTTVSTSPLFDYRPDWGRG